MSTLLLGRSDVSRHVDALTLLAELREAFRTVAEHLPPEVSRVQVPLPEHGHTRVTLPGVLRGLPAYTVRLQTLLPEGAPGASDVVHLHALQTGELLAVMDMGQLSMMCAGVVGALAADVLARPDASRVALIGAGVAASLQLKSLRLVRSLQHARVYDGESVRAVEFATRMYQGLKLPVRTAESVEEAVADADIVIVTMAAREPCLFPGMLRGGTHVSVVGADEPMQAALSTGLVRQSTLFRDHGGFMAAHGAPAGAGLGDEATHAELGQVLAGTRPGRTDPAQVTLFSTAGAPFQELVAAWHVYQGARLDDSMRRVDFGA